MLLTKRVSKLLMDRGGEREEVAINEERLFLLSRFQTFVPDFWYVCNVVFSLF